MSDVNSAAPVADVSSAPVDESNPAEGTEEDLEASEEEIAPAAKKRINKLKLKVFGKDVEEDLPFEFDDDPKAVEYMTKQMQLAKAAQKSMSDKTQLEKEISSFIDELKKNPRKVLNDPSLGIDFKRLVAETIEEEVANSQKTPEQIEYEKLQSELKELKESREKEKKDGDERDRARMEAQEIERYDQMMTAALEKSDLPKSPYVVKKMADYMLMGLKQGLDVTPDDVMPLVREEMTNDLKEMFAVMPDEVIEALVGKDVIGRIRKKNAAKAKAAPASLKAIKETGQATPKEDKAREKIPMKNFFGF